MIKNRLSWAVFLFRATPKRFSRLHYMKRLLTNLVCCLGLATPLQAQDTLQDSLEVYIPKQFETDRHEPFLIWKEEPKSFEFMLCDRWGEIIVSTKENPHFTLDDLLDEKGVELKMSSTYVIILHFIGADGMKRKCQTPSFYMGFYCSG